MNKKFDANVRIFCVFNGRKYCGFFGDIHDSLFFVNFYKIKSVVIR